MTAIHTSTLVMTAEDLSDVVMTSSAGGPSEGTPGTPVNPGPQPVTGEEMVTTQPPSEVCGGSHSPNLSRSSTSDVIGGPARTAGQDKIETDVVAAAEEVNSGNEGAA
jgi:hypothetical protein